MWAAPAPLTLDGQTLRSKGMGFLAYAHERLKLGDLDEVSRALERANECNAALLELRDKGAA